MNDHELRDDGENGGADEWRTDERIAKQAVQVITWNAMIPEGRIQVAAERGWVTLTGRVGWHFQRRAAEGAVRQLSGARGVSNLIEVEPPDLAAGRARIRADDGMRRAPARGAGLPSSRPAVAD